MWGEIHANIIHDRGEAVCSIPATSIFNDVDFSGEEKQIRTARTACSAAFALQVTAVAYFKKCKHIRYIHAHTHTYRHNETAVRKERQPNPCFIYML